MWWMWYSFAYPLIVLFVSIGQDLTLDVDATVIMGEECCVCAVDIYLRFKVYY